MNLGVGIVGARSGWVLSSLLAACGAGLLGCGGSTRASGQASGQASGETPANASAEAPAPALAANALAPTAPRPPAVKPPAPVKPRLQPAAQEKSAPEKPAEPKTLRITLAELADRRDLWPAKVRLTKKVGFSPTEIYKAGSEFDLVEIAGRDLQLDIGGEIIEAPSTSTDILERASDLMASLTPEQLALTAQTLPKRPELWPVELAMTKSLGFSNGSKVPVGRVVLLRTFEGEQVNVYDRELKTFYTAAVNETDIVARARERLKLGEKDREPFFIRSVGATLETTGSAEKDAAFSKSDYVFVYQARLGCGRCAAFLPQLAETYGRLKPAHPEFEAVFVSADFNAADAKKLAEREKLPGRAVAYDRRLEASDLGTQTQGGELLPLVYLYDKSGKLVSRNQPNGGSPSAADILAVLEKKLGEKR